MTSSARRQGGFTILELLVAFAIMAISLGMLYRVSGGSARAVGDMEHYQRAIVLAESILAMRDAIPEEGWVEAGRVAGFDWRVAGHGRRALRPRFDLYDPSLPGKVAAHRPVPESCQRRKKLVKTLYNRPALC